MESNSKDKLLWNEYLNYLKNWAESHQDIGFMGCCPVCFDEWLEYEGSEL